MQNEVQKLKIRLNQFRSQNYKRATLKKRKPFYINYNKSIQKSFNNFSNTFKAQRLSEKFKRLEIVKHPRDIITFF